MKKGSNITASDVLLANQLYYKTQARDYDRKNHVVNPAISRYYRRLFERHVFSAAPSEGRDWRVCDVGCGTGFLESVLQNRVAEIYASDAAPAMLQIAQRKFPEANIHWLLADARQLPLARGQFDLVCSNAMLHHVFDYEPVLASMVNLIKPGGRLFLGYEPNAIPYRLAWPALKFVGKIVPEHRDRDRIRSESGQNQHPSLIGKDIHELSEFHIFHRRGIDPFKLRDRLAELGMVNMRLHFSFIYQAALLKDAGVPLPVDGIPDWLYRLPGQLNLSFSLTGTKQICGR